jgi:hypothetical protein
MKVDWAELHGEVRAAIVNEYARQVHQGGYSDGIDFDGLANAVVEFAVRPVIR